MKIAEVRHNIIEAVKALPGITSPEIVELTGMKRQEVTQHLAVMAAEGVLERVTKMRPHTGKAGRRTVYAYSVSQNPTPTVVVKPKAKAPAENVETALRARISDLSAKLAEAEQWREDAIRRYPDLAVDPLVLKARKIVAMIYHGKLDTTRESDAMAGRLDKSPIMEVALAALQS